MAAKVVMVAVPTVLGIASIRVHTVKEAPADGLVTRETLNIYTPPLSAQVKFVPESPGFLESGLTAARESVLPFAQAVKGAWVSVKRGSVNLSHAGQDVFYYLKDPPPEFLPRLGTVTMAGLLGMFLARKGSRFKRVAVPVGLMSVGASVCYPAQTVALFKVTGKKAYAAGKWSSAAVSSLLTSKEPVASQSAAVPNPDSAVAEEASDPSSTTETSTKSSTISETEVESAESLPTSDEPIITVIPEEESSVTLTETSPDQVPTETSTAPLTSPPSEELPAPVESEETSDIKRAAEGASTDTSPAESTPSSEPETIENAAVESVSAESAAVESAPVEDAPVEDAPVEAAPVDAVALEAAPVEDAPSSEETSSPKVPEQPAEAVVESAETRPAEFTDLPPVAAVEEAPTPTVTPPPLQQPAGENSREGSAFKPDPSLMDFGQSNPDDEDLYSTRS
ncbi:MICOS complex subunit MIC27 [Brachyistius frenatus]|uniref:MICOS complex subunit MIC27 n=1 Tax=Brachyistius frenatus TaxID=100188 RepID=UPI0037E712A5